MMYTPCVLDCALRYHMMLKFVKYLKHINMSRRLDIYHIYQKRIIYPKYCNASHALPNSPDT
jgi:hypothetical protein